MVAAAAAVVFVVLATKSCSFEAFSETSRFCWIRLHRGHSVSMQLKQSLLRARVENEE